VERKDDGNTRAVKVTTQKPGTGMKNPLEEIPEPAIGIFPFHPQQKLLNHFPIVYTPEQLPFHPQIPVGTSDNWKRMMQWA